jgi:hypothetical protein
MATTEEQIVEAAKELAKQIKLKHDGWWMAYAQPAKVVLILVEYSPIATVLCYGPSRNP